MSWFWLSGALAALAGGCADTATCDPNEILYAGQCMPVPMQEPDAAASDEPQGQEAVDAGSADTGQVEDAPTDGAGDGTDDH